MPGKIDIDYDKLAKRWIRGRLKQWSYYRGWLMCRGQSRRSIMGSIVDEAASFRRGDRLKNYPYQNFVYQCQACGKILLRPPRADNGSRCCPHCEGRAFRLIRGEGVAGKRVYASMIRTTGPGSQDWLQEEETQAVIDKLPLHLRRIIKANYLNFKTQQKNAEAMNLKLRNFQKYLYIAEQMIYEYLISGVSHNRKLQGKPPFYQ